MNRPSTLLSKLALALALTWLSSALEAAATKPGVPVVASTNTVFIVGEVEIPQSLFVVPASPKLGRNPFFPLSAIVPSAPTNSQVPAPVDLSGFVLNGITSPPKRTAMINGRTFEPGEEGEVRLPGGSRELIRCIEIRNESAVIQVRGERRELKLRAGY